MPIIYVHSAKARSVNCLLIKMNRHNLDFGKTSESEAAEFLKNQGYKILELNYRSIFGEIDIVAKDGRVICFIEVKSRSTSAFGLPKEAVNRRKQYKLSQSALAYLKERRLLNHSCRFDVLALSRDEQGQPGFELLKDAFELNGKYTY